MSGLAGLLQSLSELLAPVFEFIGWAFPFKIYRICDGELGIILTLGKVRRKNAERKPGLTICFAFEELVSCQCDGLYIDLSEQALLTSDNKVIVINAGIHYEIIDPELAVLYTDNINLMVEGICMNYIREYSRTKTINELRNSSVITKEVTKEINKITRKHGAKVRNVMITDLRPHNVTMICDTVKSLQQ